MRQRSSVFASQVEPVLQELLKLDAPFVELEPQLRRLILDQLPCKERNHERRAKRLRHLVRICARNNARLDRSKRVVLIEALLSAIQERRWLKALSMIWEPKRPKRLLGSHRMSIHLAHELLARVELLLMMECLDNVHMSRELFCNAARSALRHAEARFFADEHRPDAKNTLFSRRYARKLSRELYRLALFSGNPLDAANALIFKRRSGEALRKQRTSTTQALKVQAPKLLFDGDIFARPVPKPLLH